MFATPIMAKQPIPCPKKGKNGELKFGRRERGADRDISKKREDHSDDQGSIVWAAACAPPGKRSF